jgi:hypothetical protein
VAFDVDTAAERPPGIRIQPSSGKYRFINDPKGVEVAYCDITYTTDGAKDNRVAYEQMADGVKEVIDLLFAAGINALLVPFLTNHQHLPILSLVTDPIPNDDVSKYIYGFPRRDPGTARVRVLLSFDTTFARAKKETQDALGDAGLGLWKRPLQRECYVGCS